MLMRFVLEKKAKNSVLSQKHFHPSLNPKGEGEPMRGSIRASARIETQTLRVSTSSAYCPHPYPLSQRARGKQCAGRVGR